MRYLIVSLAILGAFCSVGALSELLANLAPQLLPGVISTGLEQSAYKTLHEQTVVRWWVRGSNILNFIIGIALIASVFGIAKRRRWAWVLARSALVVMIVIGVIGGWVLTQYLFPAMDNLDSFPVDRELMKNAMLAGPVAIVAVCLLKFRLLGRPRIRDQFAATAG